MKLQKYFSLWWESKHENPFLFYGIIITTAILFGAIIGLVKVQKLKNKRRKQVKQQTLEVPQAQKKIFLNAQELKNEDTIIIQQNVEENIFKKSNDEQSDKIWVVKTSCQATVIIDNPKTLETTKKIDKLPETKSEVSNPILTIPVLKVEIFNPEKEESKEKYIGYNPINVFAQTEPLNFPYVIMPKINSVIKFPKKGRVGRKGFKEESFKDFIEKFFSDQFQVFDDRFIMVKNNNTIYEPDFTLIDEKNDLNIFLDIEIDEPYEGLNDLTRRKPTHFQYSDTNRNNAFRSRGWIVVRFAEIQVHQEPNACCRFLVDVIKSIHPRFVINQILNNTKQIQPIRQWTKVQAEVWSKEKYREKYLKILSFGLTENNKILEEITETELEKNIEKKVVEEASFIPPLISEKTFPNTQTEIFNKAINSDNFLSFSYQGRQTIVKPKMTTKTDLTAFCYVQNKEKVFKILEISNLLLKENYYTQKVERSSAGLEKITIAVTTSIIYKKHLRMKYTRGSWTDPETGEFTSCQESLRTISNIGIANEVLEQEHINRYNLKNDIHINAYCNKDDMRKTFRFDRIGEIEILNI